VFFGVKAKQKRKAKKRKLELCLLVSTSTAACGKQVAKKIGFCYENDSMGLNLLPEGL
jgi:hypothetical protein